MIFEADFLSLVFFVNVGFALSSFGWIFARQMFGRKFFQAGEHAFPHGREFANCVGGSIFGETIFHAKSRHTFLLSSHFLVLEIDGECRSHERKRCPKTSFLQASRRETSPSFSREILGCPKVATFK